MHTWKSTEMEDKGKLKESKGARSCINCRKGKSRCDIPDRGAIRPSTRPQPPHLACHRCNILKLPCVIDVSLTIDQQGYETASGSVRRRSISPNRRSTNSSSSPSSSSHFFQSAREVRHPSDIETYRESERKIHVFEPDLSGFGYEETVKIESSPMGLENGKAYRSHQIAPAVDVEEKLQSLRPFQYLHGLCLIQPDFLAPSVKYDEMNGNSLNRLLERHEASIDWLEMGQHIQAYQLHLPFLEPFDNRRLFHYQEEFYLATRLYLASLRTDLVDLQADLIVYLRSQTLSCALRGAENEDEAAALVSLALYEPLLLVKSAGQIQLDGRGILAAAATASRMLQLEKTPSMMQEFDTITNAHQLIKRASIWITIAYVSAYCTFANSVDQSPLLECSLEDLKIMETTCHRWLNASSRFAEQASLLSLLLSRYRSLIEFRQIVRKSQSELQSLPVTPLTLAEPCLRGANADCQRSARRMLGNLNTLRQILVLPSLTSDMFMDYLELETEQIHILCILHLTELSLLQVASFYGRPIDLNTLVRRLIQDEATFQFTSSAVATHKNDISKRLTTLFTNFVHRWCRPIQNKQQRNQQQQQQKRQSQVEYQALPLTTTLSISFALPPAMTCSCVLANVKTMADFLLGYLYFNFYPRDCLDDCEVGEAIVYSRAQSEALLRLANYQNNNLFHSKGHRDLYRLTADIVTRTSQAMYEWAATCKGLRSTIVQQGNTIREESPTHHSEHSQSRASAMHQKIKAARLNTQLRDSTAGQDFEKLLAEVLCTPIIFQ